MVDTMLITSPTAFTLRITIKKAAVASNQQCTN